MRAAAAEVEVRDLAAADVDAYIAYWHSPGDGSLDSLGVDRTRMYPAKKMRESLLMQIERNTALPVPELTVLAITYRGQCVGVHELTNLERGEQAIMHAHLWSNYRGVGIGVISYVKAMALYFERFALQTIVFETPKSNLAANRLKQKLGLSSCGPGSIDLPFLKSPLETNTYRVPRQELRAICHRVGVTLASCAPDDC